MKYFVLIVLFFAAMSFAQVGKYSHIVSGGFNRAGYRLASGFAAWSSEQGRYINLPRANFGAGTVSDVATAGRGFLVVGTFTSVNGMNANGIAFYDGSRWCAMPHLNLYYYVKPFPAPTTVVFPNVARSGAIAGSAVAVSAIGNTYYVFGGQVTSGGNPQRVRFNQVGTTTAGVAGLVALNYDSNANNFTVAAIQSSVPYETRGNRGGTPAEPNNPGFPADSAPEGVVGKTKFRALNVNGNAVTFYVHPNVGTAGNVWRWRQTDTEWVDFTRTQNTPFNVSGTVTTTNVLAQSIGGFVRDFDHDGVNTIFVAGQFDNSANTTASVRYVNVACTGNSHTVDVTWTVAANWNANEANINNFNATGTTGAWAIAVESVGTFYLGTSYRSTLAATTTTNDINQQTQYYVYKISNAGLNSNNAQWGQRFDTGNAADPRFSRISVYNGRLFVFGTFSYYNYIHDAENFWPRRYTKCISNAVVYSGSDFIDAYGGFTGLTATSYPLIANNANGIDFIYVEGATAFYDIFSAGSIVAYNTDTKRWANLAPQRLTTRGNLLNNVVKGGNGNALTVHFIKKQRSGVSDAVVVAGQFDWYGTQYLGSVAFLRTGANPPTFEQIGGGVYSEENTGGYTADKVTPLYYAGKVNDIEEINGKFYVAGIFTKNIQGKCLNHIASISATPSSTDVFDNLKSGCDNEILDLIADGDNLYVGGSFTSCGGVDGTRKIARYDTKKEIWWPLNAGLPDGTVHAMIWYRGRLLAGGSFTNAPGVYRTANSVTGLYEWNGNAWAPLFARCQKDCDGTTAFTWPFGTANDPVARSVSNVRSLRTIGGNLYIHGNVLGAAGDKNLIQYDGNTFKQYGAAVSSSCGKQGCIASNQSNIIGVGFTRPGDVNYNQNYQQYSPENNNWMETFNGFDAAPTIVASASYISISLIALFLVVLMAF